MTLKCVTFCIKVSRHRQCTRNVLFIILVAGDRGIRGEVVEKRRLEKDQDQEIVTDLFVSSVLTKSRNPANIL